ncbi:GIY-YIG nuclease family protein [bacterium]|nr:GIY-YIG nuclease family protein [bacterium]
MFYCVYILRCSDNRIYIGCTKNVKDRMLRHQKGQIRFTSLRLPVELVSCVFFRDQYSAFSFEKYLKTGSGRAFLKKHLM